MYVWEMLKDFSSFFLGKDEKKAWGRYPISPFNFVSFKFSLEIKY